MARSTAKPKQRERLLERLAMHWLRHLDRRPQQDRPPTRPLTHILNRQERLEVERRVGRCIRRAFLIGCLAAAMIVAAQIVLGAWLGLGEEVDHRPLMALLGGEWQAGAGTAIGYYSGVLVICIVIGMAEIIVLQADALRCVHGLSRIVGMRLFAGDHDAQQESVAAALARAAMELPNPPDVVCGIDPRCELARWRLLVTTLIYKAKIGVSNFLLKALVRRLLGRAALRSLVTLVAIPVTGLWAAWVCARVMREARSRVLGPSAVHEVIDALLATCPEPDQDQRRLIHQALAAVIICRADLHPNHQLLLLELTRRIDGFGPQPAVGSRVLLDDLAVASSEERALALRAMGCAVAVDGRLCLSERRLLKRTLQVCGQAVDLTPYRELAEAFVSGSAIPARLIWRCAPDANEQVYTDRWQRRSAAGTGSGG